MYTLRRVAYICLGLGLLAAAFSVSSLSAQQAPSQSLYGGLRWRLIGPFRAAGASTP